MDSGLLHHRHRIGQPLRKTVVLIPGPSRMANLSMLKTQPVTSALSALSVLLKDKPLKLTMSVAFLFFGRVASLVDQR
jgi:hypothetical protein